MFSRVEVSTAREKDPSVDQFLVAFDSFAQAVRRARGARASDPDGGLTLSQYGLLEPLADRPDARVSELAEQAGIAASTASRILDALERRGIVARRPTAQDRRGVAVALTRAGATVLSSEHEWLRARQRDFYENLPDEERALAPDLLRRLAALIDELAAGPE
jgi:DNA-binding MarR family transcriptional regulator